MVDKNHWSSRFFASKATCSTTTIQGIDTYLSITEHCKAQGGVIIGNAPAGVQINNPSDTEIAARFIDETPRNTKIHVCVLHPSGTFSRLSFYSKRNAKSVIKNLMNNNCIFQIGINQI